MSDLPESHLADAVPARPKRRNPRWLLPSIVVVAMLAAWVLLPEVSANTGPSSAWDPACPRIESTWHTQSRLNPGMLRWFLTSVGPIAIQDWVAGGATAVQLELTNEAGASVASPRVRGMVATAAIERGDSLWVLCQGSSKTSFELVELGLHDLAPRSQAHYEVEGTGRRREEPLDLLRFADGSLGLIYESSSESQNRSPRLVRFDPLTRAFGSPVSLANRPNQTDPMCVDANGSLAKLSGQAVTLLDPKTGQVTTITTAPSGTIDPNGRVARMVQAGNAITFDPFFPNVCVQPPLALNVLFSHPAMPLSNGQPTVKNALSIAGIFVRSWATGRAPEEVASEQMRIEAVLLATHASPFSVELGPEYRAAVRSNFLHADSPGIFLYALDGTTALCAQVVSPPLDGRAYDPPTGFLRFGTLDATSTSIDWKGHIPLPKGGQEDMSDRVTIIPGPDRWMVYLAETNFHGANIEDPIPYAWAAIPNPVGVLTPLQVQLCGFAQPLPPSGEAP